MAAGSAMANHIRRPNGSVKPPIGFQAAPARASSPSCSQPFQGKSLSLTVRRNIGEAEALERIEADVLDAGRERGVEVFALHRVAGDAARGSPREQPHEVALQVDALHGALRSAAACSRSATASICCLRAGSPIEPREQAIGVKPARPHPARAQPAVERHGGVGDEARRAHLLDGGIPGRAVGSASRGERGSAPARLRRAP